MKINGDLWKHFPCSHQARRHLSSTAEMTGALDPPVWGGEGAPRPCAKCFLAPVAGVGRAVISILQGRKTRLQEAEAFARGDGMISGMNRIQPWVAGLV